MNLLAKLKSAREAATSGEWTHHIGHSNIYTEAVEEDGGRISHEISGFQVCSTDNDEEDGSEVRNAAFIALAANHIGQLVEALEIARETLVQIDELGEYICDEEGLGHECPNFHEAHKALKRIDEILKEGE